MASPNSKKSPGGRPSWAELVRHARAEEAPAVDVRNRVRTALVAARARAEAEGGWPEAILALFSLRQARLAASAGFACAALLAASIGLPEEVGETETAETDPVAQFLNNGDWSGLL